MVDVNENEPKNYRIIEGNNLKEFEARVTSALQSGWSLHHGILQTQNGNFIQAVTRYY